MKQDKLWKVPLCIVLTILSIILFVAGSETVTLHGMLSQKTVAKILEPFSITDLYNNAGKSYGELLTNSINQSILSIAKQEAAQQGFTGNIATYAGKLLTEEEVDSCIDDAEIKRFVASKAGEYFKAFLSSNKSVTLSADEVLALQSVQNIRTLIETKLQALPVDVELSVSDDEMMEIMQNALGTYGLSTLVSTDGASATRAFIKEAKKGVSLGYRYLIDKMFSFNAVSILEIIGACLCLLVILYLRRHQLARGSLYGIIAMTTVAGFFCLEGTIIYAAIRAIPTASVQDMNLAVAVDFVMRFIKWCAVVARNQFLTKGLWFLAGSIPFWGLDIWYHIDKYQVEKRTQGIRKRMPTED